jgi:hypothetical protein
MAAERKEDVDQDDYGECYFLDLYEMLKCRGCEGVTLRHTRQWGSRDAAPITFYYPPAVSRRAPLWIDHGLYLLLYDKGVPTPICSLMKEIYTAVQNGSTKLVAMGIRAVLESVMIERVGDQGTFKSNMDAFQKAGYLSLRQAGTLDSLLEAGHAAIHRGWEPKNDDIVTLLDITENLIETVYLHEHRARDLDKKLPKRGRNL